MSQWSLSGRKYQRLKGLVLAAYGRTCWLCGHDGANGIDHVIPLELLATDPAYADISPWDLTWWRPAHSSMPCPTCRIDCNSRRGNQRHHIPALNTSRQW